MNVDELEEKLAKEIEAGVFYRTEIAKLNLKLEEARNLITWAQDIFKNCTVASDTCMCGQNMGTHGNPMDEGHAATDSGEYYSSLWLIDSEVFLNEKQVDKTNVL
jgi:hypothetical protein